MSERGRWVVVDGEVMERQEDDRIVSIEFCTSPRREFQTNYKIFQSNARSKFQSESLQSAATAKIQEQNPSQTLSSIRGTGSTTYKESRIAKEGKPFESAGTVP
jgi:hypothetical protein